MAKSSAQALIVAFRVSLGFNFESMKSITTLRPAIPPALLTTFAHAFMASTEALKTPGAMGVSTSAMTARRISLPVIPTSAALGLALWAPATEVPAPTSVMTVTTAVVRTRETRKVPPNAAPAEYRATSRYNIWARRSTLGAPVRLRVNRDRVVRGLLEGTDPEQRDDRPFGAAVERDDVGGGRPAPNTDVDGAGLAAAGHDGRTDQGA